MNTTNDLKPNQELQMAFNNKQIPTRVKLLSKVPGSKTLVNVMNVETNNLRKLTIGEPTGGVSIFFHEVPEKKSLCFGEVYENIHVKYLAPYAN